MTRITGDRGSLNKDDRIDAVAMAVYHFTAQMALDSFKMAEVERQSRLDDALRNFHKHVIGNMGQPKNPNVWKQGMPRLWR